MLILFIIFGYVFDLGMVVGSIKGKQVYVTIKFNTNLFYFLKLDENAHWTKQRIDRVISEG